MTDRHGEESRPEEQKPETAAPFFQEVTDQELLDRRAEILRSVGKTYEELVALARTGSLTGPEWLAWDNLKGINFLLGG